MYFQKWNCPASLFPQQNYNVMSPNSYTHISVWDRAISFPWNTQIRFSLQCRGRPGLRMYCTIPTCIIQCRIHQAGNSHSRSKTWMFSRWLDLHVIPYFFQAKIYTYFSVNMQWKTTVHVGIYRCFLDSFFFKGHWHENIDNWTSWSALFRSPLRIVYHFFTCNLFFRASRKDILHCPG